MLLIDVKLTSANIIGQIIRIKRFWVLGVLYIQNPDQTKLDSRWIQLNNLHHSTLQTKMYNNYYSEASMLACRSQF